MPIETGIWRLSGKELSKKIGYIQIDSERKLEEILLSNIGIIGEDYLLIGKQVRTSYGKYIDLLAINREGKITIIELKKDKTPREVVAQTLDYASWVKDLSYEDILQIFKDTYGNTKSFEKSFVDKYDENPPEEINEEHDMLIVATNLDNETERIINYLSKYYNVPINVVFFKFFKDDNTEYLTRSWLIDPQLIEEKAIGNSIQNKSETWNGHDFVVNIESSFEVSAWEDYKKYGFISASGGQRYISPLTKLFIGARIFAMIPGKGYLGVGEVIKTRTNIKEYVVENGKEYKMLSEMDLKAKFLKNDLENNEKCAYVVGIKWIKANEESKPYWEKGLKANQNTAFRLNSTFTLQRLLKHFEIE